MLHTAKPNAMGVENKLNNIAQPYLIFVTSATSGASDNYQVWFCILGVTIPNAIKAKHAISIKKQKQKHQVYQSKQQMPSQSKEYVN